MESKEVDVNQEVDSGNLTQSRLPVLIQRAAEKDRQIKAASKELDAIKAELQSRAEQILEEHNIKFTEFFGDKNSYVAVSVAQTLDVLNMQKVQELLGAELLRDKITEKPVETKYEYDKKFKQALIAVITGDYDNEFTVEEIVTNAGWCATDSQKKVLLKKLKGEYKGDRKAVYAILNREDIDIDIELYYIYKIKNWELIQAYFDMEGFKSVEEMIKKYVTVSETPKIELKYS